MYGNSKHALKSAVALNSQRRKKGIPACLYLHRQLLEVTLGLVSEDVSYFQ